MSVPEPDGDNVLAKMFGGLLMAVGFLIATLSGLCSAVVIVNMFSQNIRGTSTNMMLVLVFGGIPIAVGVGLVLLGLSIYNRD